MPLKKAAVKKGYLWYTFLVVLLSLTVISFSVLGYILLSSVHPFPWLEELLFNIFPEWVLPFIVTILGFLWIAVWLLIPIKMCKCMFLNANSDADDT